MAGQTLKYHKIEPAVPTWWSGDSVVPRSSRWWNVPPVLLSRGRDCVGRSLRCGLPIRKPGERIGRRHSPLPLPSHCNGGECATRCTPPPPGGSRSRTTPRRARRTAGRLRACLGLGVLEHDAGVLRAVTNQGDGMRGLRLGSVRLDLDTFEVHPLRLGEVMFGGLRRGINRHQASAGTRLQVSGTSRRRGNA